MIENDSFLLRVGRFLYLPVAALVFYTVFTVVGISRRLLGVDPLRLTWKKKSNTYWKKR